MARIEMKIEGLADLEKQLKALGPRLVTVGGQAIFEEGNKIMNASKEIVPVDEGHLKASGTTHPVDFSDGRADLVLSYGGDVDYAIIQHETPPEVWGHKPGQTWKYLQNPAHEAVRGMAQRIGASIRARLEREGVA